MLTEWWTYRPHDFLMFSPRFYWRLFESINAAWWPLALALVWAGGAAFTFALALRARAQRPALWPFIVCLLLLAAAWGFVAHAYLWQRLAPIFWAAEAAAWAFALQALAWLVLAGLLKWQPAALNASTSRRARIGAAFVAAAVLLYPLLAPLADRPWAQAEIFGLAPDPTVLFSLGLLLHLQAAPGATLAARALLALLWCVPLAWCLFSAATLALLGAWQALVPLAAAALSLGAAWSRQRRV